MNVGAISGHLVDTPELKTTNSGVYVTSFTVAVKRPFSKDETDFIDCVAWRNNAEFICKYFEKGQRIECNGYIQTRNYEDKNGNKRKATEIVVDNVSFGESKRKSDEQTVTENQIRSALNATMPEGTYQEVPDEYDEDDLPF